MSLIAVIDDDKYINDMLYTLLTREGYDVVRAFSGKSGLRLLTDNTPDLVLLDLMMPELSGEQLLPMIEDVPVIVMSAKCDVSSKVNLLMSGAADYITKPFDTSELLARIKVRLRESAAADSLEYCGLSLDENLREAQYGSKTIKLTKTELAILKILMRNPNQVITKSQILDRISEDTLDGAESSLKVHVSNLRRKLRTLSELDFIESVWGIGFKMRKFEDNNEA